MGTRQPLFAFGMGIGILSAFLMLTEQARAASCDLETYLVWSGLGSPTVCDNHTELEAERVAKEQQGTKHADEKVTKDSEPTTPATIEAVTEPSIPNQSFPIVTEQSLPRELQNPLGEAVLAEPLSRQDEARPLERSYFVKAFGGFGSQKARVDEPGSDVSMGGIVGSADLYANDRLRLGLIGMYAQIQVDVNGDSEKVDISSLKLGGQASMQRGNWHLDSLFLYGPEITSTNRMTSIGGTEYKLTNDYTNHRVTTAFELGYTERLGSIIVQPTAGVELDWHYQAKATESGHGSGAVWIKRSSHWSGETKLGLTLSTVMMMGDIPVVPIFGASWHHRFGKLSNTTSMSFDSGLTYQQVGRAPARDAAELNASLGFNLKPNMVLNMGYSGRFDRFESLHSGSVGFRIDF